MNQLEFYFDYRSPYAYLAHTQLRLLTSEVLYRPFEIRGVMEKVGNVPTSVICKPKNRYIQADLRRWVSRYGVPFGRHPDIMEIDSQRLLRATLWAGAQGPVNGLVSALFNAMWGGGCCGHPPPFRIRPPDAGRRVRRASVAGGSGSGD